jgi:hypothetical protein
VSAQKKGPLGLDLDQSKRLCDLDLASLMARAINIESDHLAAGIILGVADEVEAIGLTGATEERSVNDTLYLISLRLKVAAEITRRCIDEARRESGDGADEGSES